MSDYFVSFNGHIIENLRPDGWPKIVHEKFVYRANDVSVLANYLNTRASDLKNAGGLTVELDKELLTEDMKSDKGFSNTVYVPMHMISHISYTVREMTVKVPEEGDEGILLQ